MVSLPQVYRTPLVPLLRGIRMFLPPLEGRWHEVPVGLLFRLRRELPRLKPKLHFSSLNYSFEIILSGNREVNSSVSFELRGQIINPLSPPFKGDTNVLASLIKGGGNEVAGGFISSNKKEPPLIPPSQGGQKTKICYNPHHGANKLEKQTLLR